MSSLIEQAAQRLEQLRRAGVVVPETGGAAAQAAAEMPSVVRQARSDDGSARSS